MRMARAPASMMTMAMTQAKIGRSMKKRDMARSFSSGIGRLRRGVRCFLLNDRLYGRTRAHFLQAIDDELVAWIEARRDQPVAADGAIRRKAALLDLVLASHHHRARVSPRGP